MVYPAAFHRVVLIGNLYSDTFNTTVSMVPTGGGSLPAVSDDLVDAVGAAVETWFSTAFVSPWHGIGITSRAQLTSVKVNRIGTDGKYVDPETREYTLPSPAPGGASSLNLAPQLSIAMTLRGTNERARAGRGRMYFPPSVAISNIASDGRLTSTDALNTAKGGLFLLSALNDVYLTEGVSAVAGIASKQGSGAFQTVVQVSVGRVVDTIRSRRNKLPEEPEFWGSV